MSFNSMRDTCHRNRAQMNNRKYQRSSRNWNSGRLTQPSHQPAIVGRQVPFAGAPCQLVTSSAICVRQSNPTPTT